jgi:hypothetical protein
VPTKNQRRLDSVDLVRVGSRAVAHRLQRLAVGRWVHAENRTGDEVDVAALLRDEAAQERLVRGTRQAMRGASRSWARLDAQREEDAADVDVEVPRADPARRNSVRLF